MQQDFDKSLDDKNKKEREEWERKLAAAQNDPALLQKLMREMKEWESNVAEQNEAERFK